MRDPCQKVESAGFDFWGVLSIENKNILIRTKGTTTTFATRNGKMHIAIHAEPATNKEITSILLPFFM